MQYLKDQYKWKLRAFVAFNIVVFCSVVYWSDTGFLKNLSDWSVILAKGWPPFVALLLTLILTGIIPSQQKEKLVFWRWEHPLPGCRVFTELAPNDPRIDLNQIRQQYGELPTAPEQQNNLWYSIYKEHRDKPTVEASHRDRLFTRDLTAISFILLILLPVSLLAIGDVLTVEVVYSGYLALQYLALRIVAKNYGKRFTCNVLAETGKS